jgi:uncharacterized protein (DUF305 family)
VNRHAGRAPAVALVALTLLAGCADDSGAAPSDRATRVALAERSVWDRYGDVAEVDAPADTTEAQALVDMIAHHRDAIAGSQAVLARTASPAVADFAERLIRVQTEQIAQMETWLAAWYPQAAATSQWVPMFADPATSATDAAYLATMIDHHEHATSMYAGWVALGLIQHDELGLLAAHIAKGQEGEIARMTQLQGDA